MISTKPEACSGFRAKSTVLDESPVAYISEGVIELFTRVCFRQGECAKAVH